MRKAHVGGEPLRERAGHQEVPQVDDELGERELEVRSTRGDHAERRELPGGGQVCGGDHGGFRHGEADGGRLNAEGERNGEIAEADRQAVAQAGRKILCFREHDSKFPFMYVVLSRSFRGKGLKKGGFHRLETDIKIPARP